MFGAGWFGKKAAVFRKHVKQIYWVKNVVIQGITGSFRDPRLVGLCFLLPALSKYLLSFYSKHVIIGTVVNSPSY